MGSYVSRPQYQVGNLVFVEETVNFNIHRGTRRHVVYEGTPGDTLDHYNARDTSFPKHINVVHQKVPGPYHRLVVEYGIDLFSIWGRLGSQHEVPLVASLMGQALDFAFPGWARFIEIEIDKHYTAQLSSSRFDTDTVKASNLFEIDGSTAAVLNTSEHSAAELDNLAIKYAITYIRGVEVFFEPRFVITNTITVSADFNDSHYPVLDTNVNRMLSPFRMAGEAIQAGEVIPAGIIPATVNWWHKQPYQKQQTADNTFIVTREWWGIDYFDQNLYEKVT